MKSSATIRFISVLTLLVTGTLTAQNTVGLLSYDFDRMYDGYNLLYPHNQPAVFLLNNCGEIVHQWDAEPDFRPGNTAYLLENGNLVRTKRPASVAGNPIWAGGGGATVEIRTWDNELIWTFTLNDSLRRLHHDIEPMPNGNILMIAWELKTEEESIQAGRDPATIAEGELWPDYILEVQPIGSDDYEIVWEWHVWDHLVQDFDDSKDNFGVISEHPERVNINYDNTGGEADWLHSNAIDYNPIWDQIVLCVPEFHEVWVIDHSTTTEEAAGSTGGLSGMGGDLIFRWGNPAAYDSGDSSDQKFFYQHDAQWLLDFIPGSHPDYGKMAVFNNRVGVTTSTVNIFAPIYDMYEASYAKIGNVFAPLEFDWTYSHPDTVRMHSTGLSSFQLLPNGNRLIGVGRRGYAFEIDNNEEIIFEYVTPLRGGNRVEQGETLGINDNLTFRFKRYPMDYPAFDGRDMSGKGFIELNPDTAFCDIISSINDPDRSPAPNLFPNPASTSITIEWLKGGRGIIEIYDQQGRMHERLTAFGGRAFIDVSQYLPGVYFVTVNGSRARKVIIE